MRMLMRQFVKDGHRKEVHALLGDLLDKPWSAADAALEEDLVKTEIVKTELVKTDNNCLIFI